jgi:predicted dehydrogenase
MISVGLIGCGDVAECGHLPTLVGDARFQVVAVCDLNPQRAQLLASQAGGSAHYIDWRQLLDGEELDAVVVAVPPEVSPDIVEECLRRKLAVLDEKPLAATVEDGRRIARIVAEENGVYQSGFVLRYGDWVQELRRLVATLGQPLRIRAEVYEERLDPANHVHFNRIQGFLKNSSALTHEGSHILDYVGLWNSSPWTRVSAFAQRTSPEFLGPNVWNAQVELADLSTLHMKVAWLLPELPPSTISVEGPLGRIQFDCASGQGEYEVEAERRVLSLPPLAPEWQRQYDAFARAIERGAADCATVENALRALEITAACELSAQQGTSISRTEFQQLAGHERFDTEPRSAPQKVGPPHSPSVGRASSDMQSSDNPKY